jgi:hypothetical protein
MAGIQLHDGQLDRILEDIKDIKGDAYLFGGMKVLNYLLLALEVIALGFAGYHGLHGFVEGVLIALGVEISILVIHAIALYYEKQLHRSHESRADRLSDELREKANKLRETAEAHSFGIPPFWRLRWWWPA